MKLNEFVDYYGKIFAGAKFFGCSGVDQGKALAMTMLTSRMGPAEVAKRYHLLNFRTGSNLMLATGASLADFRQHYGGDYKLIEKTCDAAEIECKYKKNTHKVRLTWSEIDADKEDFAFDKDGNIQSNWNSPKKRRDMLWYRAASECINAVCPEVFYSSDTIKGNVEDFANIVIDQEEIEEITREEHPMVSQAIPQPEEGTEKPKPETTQKPSSPVETKAGSESETKTYEQPSSTNSSVVNVNDKADEEYIKPLMTLLVQCKNATDADDPNGDKRKIFRKIQEASQQKKIPLISEMTYKQIDSLKEQVESQLRECEIPF